MAHYDLTRFGEAIETPMITEDLAAEQCNFMHQWKSRETTFSKDVTEHMRLAQQVFWDAINLEYTCRKTPNLIVVKHHHRSEHHKATAQHKNQKIQHQAHLNKNQ